MTTGFLTGDCIQDSRRAEGSYDDENVLQLHGRYRADRGEILTLYKSRSLSLAALWPLYATPRWVPLGPKLSTGETPGYALVRGMIGKCRAKASTQGTAMEANSAPVRSDDGGCSTRGSRTRRPVNCALPQFREMTPTDMYFICDICAVTHT
jgi:hypothetical protein